MLVGEGVVGRLGPGGYPERRGQGVEAGDGKPVWSSCCLSPSFSISLTWGFRLLTCLGGRMCVCVCVCAGRATVQVSSMDSLIFIESST